MDRIAIAGLTLHETDVEGLERARRIVGEVDEGFLRDLADALAASELVLLATCNRVEVAFAREVGHLPGPRDAETIAEVLGLTPADSLYSRLWIRTGRNAVHHVLRVASSLDSLVVGEDQILAQVRQAYEHARDLGLTGPLLGPLFEAAVQVGKEVRTKTDLSQHPVSVVSLGVAHVAARFAALTKTAVAAPGGPPSPTDKAPGPRLALIGAGKMGELVARSARDLGLRVAVVANRSLEGAERVAELVGAQALDLDTFRREAPAVDAVLSATSAPGVVLDAEVLRRLAAATPAGGPLVAVDLAVPRDIEPVGEPGIEVVDLDALRALAETNRALRRRAAERAEGIVERKLTTLGRRVSDQLVAGALSDVLAEASDVFEHELGRLFTGRLAHLGEEDRRALERWARSTFGRMAHVPIRAFKDLAADFGNGNGNGAGEEDEA